MSKAEWIDSFIDKLYEHHGDDYKLFIEDGNYPFQLAVAYFDWADDGEPEETPEKAFSRYTTNEENG